MLKLLFLGLLLFSRQVVVIAVAQLFSHQVMSDSSQPHGLQHARLSCPSPSPRVCPSSCPLSGWCYPTVSSSTAPFSFCLQSFPTSGSFPMSRLLAAGGQLWELQLQHQSFQWIFRDDFLWDWLVWSPCSPRDSQEYSPAPQFHGINTLVLSLLYGPALTSIHDHWKNHSFDYTDLCQKSDIFAF